MKLHIVAAACLLASPACAANQDCGLLYRPGDEVITRSGKAVLKSCDPLLVRYRDGSEGSPSEVYRIVYPPPLDYPQWAGAMIDPNFLPRRYRH